MTAGRPPLQRYQVVWYDEYFDVPQRGVATCRAATVAFRSRDLEHEPAEFAALPGVFVRFTGFRSDAALEAWFAELDAIFKAWRARFDAGELDLATHPLEFDSRYQWLARNIDNYFAHLPDEPEIACDGLMRVESGEWVFESWEALDSQH